MLGELAENLKSMTMPVFCVALSHVKKWPSYENKHFQNFEMFSPSFMTFPDFILVLKYCFAQEIEQIELLLSKNEYTA